MNISFNLLGTDFYRTLEALEYQDIDKIIAELEQRQSKEQLEKHAKSQANYFNFIWSGKSGNALHARESNCTTKHHALLL